MSTNFYPFLIIPIPTDIPVGFGIHATSGPEGVFIICRGLKSEKAYIHKAAAAIGMTYAGFIRRVMMDASTAILHQTGEQQPDLLPKGITHRTPDE